MKPSILIVDDETSICISLSLALEDSYRVAWETEPEKALVSIREETFDAVLLDMVIGKQNGLDILRAIKQINPKIPVIIMTAYGNIRSSVAAIKAGAFTYLSKPLDVEELKLFIFQALEFSLLSEKVNYLTDELRSQYRCGKMIGDSPAMQRVYDMIEKLTDVDATVMVSGESGTGKEMVARAIHYSGKRKSERFVVTNCAAIPEGLLEDEFFGHKRGSFTGAIADKRGAFEVADKGTLFLDEIGDMPLSLQGKLLRVLQDKTLSPIGSTDTKSVDVRIIAASNKNLKDMVRSGLFREDLYYRINVVEIHLPPLRERKQDIPLLCEHFIKQNNAQQNKAIRGVTKEAEQALLAYEFPGNIRELVNALEYASILAGGEWITVGDLPERIVGHVAKESPFNGSFSEIVAGKTMHEIERMAVTASYARHRGKRKDIAAELGISERSLWSKLKEYGLE